MRHFRHLLLWLTVVVSLAGFAGAQPDGPAAPHEPKNLQLFLLIGQSNMAGRGKIELQDRLVIPGVYMLNKSMQWAPAVDPLHFDKPAIDGVGLGRTFAKVLVETAPSVSIGLIPAAFGATSLEEWKPGGRLYENAVRRTRFAMKSGTLRGILWHQGESDSNQEELANTYRERFAEFVRQLRDDLKAPNVPVVVGELGEFFHAPYADLVREQLALIPLKVPHSGFVSSGGLTAKADKGHFDSASVRELGRRYAYAFLSLDPTWAPLR